MSSSRGGIKLQTASPSMRLLATLITAIQAIIINTTRGFFTAICQSKLIEMSCVNQCIEDQCQSLKVD